MGGDISGEKYVLRAPEIDLNYLRNWNRLEYLISEHNFKVYIIQILNDLKYFFIKMLMFIIYLTSNITVYYL